jgi:hypothetical protein
MWYVETIEFIGVVDVSYGPSSHIPQAATSAICGKHGTLCLLPPSQDSFGAHYNML